MVKAWEVIDRLMGVASPQKREVQLKFFKTGIGEYGYGDLFLGVMVPQVRAIVGECYRDISFDEIEVLLHSKYHEARLTALLLLVKIYEVNNRPAKRDDINSKNIRKRIFDIYTSNTAFINNWDLVDLSAPNIVGEHLFGNDCSLLYEFALSNNLWKERIAVVATLNFIRKGEILHTFSLAKLFLNSKHDLMQKSVGWMLREAGKRECDMLRDFLNEHKNIMPRTMLRYAIERFSADERKVFMKRDI